MTAHNGTIPKVGALAPWLGSNRMLADTVGARLKGCDWVGIPFSGGLCELPYIDCRAGVANDLHRHIINLARVVRDPKQYARLVEKLDAAIFHPDELAESQRYCRAVEAEVESVGMFGPSGLTMTPLVEWAYCYFVSVWMARSSAAGTSSEFSGSLSTRWNANGGGSNTRFRGAAKALAAWHQVFQRWEFETLDCFAFLAKIKDALRQGIYADAPWPVLGDNYKHRFTESMQRRLAIVLGVYTKTRVVVRFGDHPLIREIYPESHWDYILQDSRNQGNNLVSEILLINRTGSDE